MLIFNETSKAFLHSTVDSGEERSHQERKKFAKKSNNNLSKCQKVECKKIKLTEANKKFLKSIGLSPKN